MRAQASSASARSSSVIVSAQPRTSAESARASRPRTGSDKTVSCATGVEALSNAQDGGSQVSRDGQSDREFVALPSE